MKVIEVRRDYQGARGACLACGTLGELEPDDRPRLASPPSWAEMGKRYWEVACPVCPSVIVVEK